ncbi:hypothetical protein CLAFUW4_06032 [Fulvia fulva]|uniref:Uncharacterized protein n=1 Tax=Passalora fulva TaxID=5499 RepID=A0A9Q8LH60_PASFU|nr:uncharacterized protein CLAFUR5_06176 [Fulvia fulva]KAK4623841.1 hypothetical protein CLAFUR4_06037 [Fulvia fulva]KAK4624929.1 hypothetical protein CLAFUR0_06040 [Fulvia fulva]UJO17374.1 hypothetical protein CLAFUR5_06176 [Fulvia fulva]WPV14422.1 hypothetical protein CLAFUW4_06032 [Fulvia fulva]WPV29488.1 hypothetical protein CLAFUW7_06030 [Fulvia fulva]
MSTTSSTAATCGTSRDRKSSAFQPASFASQITATPDGTELISEKLVVLNERQCIPAFQPAPSSSRSAAVTTGSKLTREKLALFNKTAGSSDLANCPLMRWSLDVGVDDRDAQTLHDWEMLIARDALAADIEACIRTKAQKM